MSKSKFVAFLGIVVCVIGIPLIAYMIIPMPFSLRFRSSEFISDYFDYDFMVMDNSGESFTGFSNEITASLTLYSLYLGEFEVLIPVENTSEVAGRSLSIGTNNEETIRSFIVYPGNITKYGLQQGDRTCQITLPSDLKANATLGIRQQVVLNFSQEDMQHLISVMIYTENRSFRITNKLFLPPELQFIRTPESSPFFDEFTLDALGSDMKVTGATVFVDYPLRLSDSFRQLQYYGNALRIVIITFAISIGISSATLFLNALKYLTEKEKK